MIWTTTDPCWVVKRSTVYREVREEIRFINDSRDRPVRNMVEVPENPAHRYGDDWYAMRLYSGPVVHTSPYCRHHWRRIATSVLDFLEDLHRGHNLVHLDIVAKNILYDKTRCQFIVADYELLIDTDTRALSNNNDDYAWYFVQYGGELDEPNCSWRMDFTMLGYLLARLTWDHYENPTGWDFMKECDARRLGSTESRSTEEILAARKATIERAHPTVRAYLDLVATIVPWLADMSAPSVEIYRRLRDVFDADKVCGPAGQS